LLKRRGAPGKKKTFLYASGKKLCWAGKTELQRRKICNCRNEGDEGPFRLDLDQREGT